MPGKIIELERQLSSATKSDERLRLMLELVEELEWSDYVDGWNYASQALELATALGDRSAIATSHEGIANCLWKLAEYPEALDNYELALDNFLSQGDLYGVARCYCGLGIINGSMENYASALECFDDGLSAARRSGKQALAATITGNIGHVYFNMGNYTDAMQCFENGLNFYRRDNDSHGAANMLSGMAGIHVYQGEHAKGLELVRRARELHKKAKRGRGVAVCMMNIGIALQKMGKLEQAYKELKSALNYARSIKLKSTEHDVLKNLSQVCSELDRKDEAHQYLELYLHGEREQKQLAVKSKNEQFRKRQLIREIQQQKKV